MSEWHKELAEKLESSEVEGSEIIHFIESGISSDETSIYDNKRELYIDAEGSDKKKEWKGKIVRSISALANSKHESQIRYLFIGFTDGTEFEGINFWGETSDDNHIWNADDAEITNILDEYLQPCPKIQVDRIESEEGEKAMIISIRRAREPPIIVEKGLQRSGGQIEIHKGAAYTRKNSQNSVMEYEGFRRIVDWKREVLREMLEDITGDLSKAIEMPTAELEEHSFSLAKPEESDNTISVETTDDAEMKVTQGVVDTSPATEVNDSLNTAVRTWTTLQDLANNPTRLTEFYTKRKELSLDDKKIEYLFKSAISTKLAGVPWLEYAEDRQEVLKKTIQDIDISPDMVIDKVLLILGEKELLGTLEDEVDNNSMKQRAKEYQRHCSKDLKRRAKKARHSETWYDGTKYKIENFNQQRNEIDQIMNEAMEKLESQEAQKPTVRDVEFLFAPAVVNA